MTRWREQAGRLRREVLALYLACRDPRVPWFVKLVAAAVVAYALSPLDLIPDFIPVLGYLDDLIVVPVGVLLVRRLVPAHVLDECRARAQAMTERPVSRAGAAFMIAIWILLLGLTAWLVVHWARPPPRRAPGECSLLPREPPPALRGRARDRPTARHPGRAGEVRLTRGRLPSASGRRRG